MKFRGAWWNTVCVDRVRMAEFQATARFVEEIRCRNGWRALAWTNDPAEAERWRRNIADEPEVPGVGPTTRLVDRQAVPEKGELTQ